MPSALKEVFGLKKVHRTRRCPAVGYDSEGASYFFQALLEPGRGERGNATGDERRKKVDERYIYLLYIDLRSTLLSSLRTSFKALGSEIPMPAGQTMARERGAMKDAVAWDDSEHLRGTALAMHQTRMDAAMRSPRENRGKPISAPVRGAPTPLPSGNTARSRSVISVFFGFLPGQKPWDNRALERIERDKRSLSTISPRAAWARARGGANHIGFLPRRPMSPKPLAVKMGSLGKIVKRVLPVAVEMEGTRTGHVPGQSCCCARRIASAHP